MSTGDVNEWHENNSELGKLLIVGLGNPGKKYQKNRHNVGFMVVDLLAEKYGINLNRVKQKAIIGDGRVSKRAVILAKPQSFMNRSGEVVGPLSRYFNVSLTNLLVIYDEIDLPFGTIRLRASGGSGGHNGMKSIINHLGTEFPRLRLGVGRPPGRMEPASYVLRDFATAELKLLGEMIDLTLLAISTFITSGIEVAMTRHNGLAINS